MHLEGNRQTNNKILAYEMFAEREKLTAYVSKPVLICDLPCEYDYFTVLLCGESIFYNNKENVYLYVGNKNTIIHFEELNRFIANCEDGKFSPIEIIYCGQVGNGDDGVENLYDIPNYILYGYDYVNRIGDGYYEFIKEGQKVVIYHANDGSIKDTF